MDKNYSTELSCLAECDGEILSIHVIAYDGEFNQVRHDGDLDDSVDSWEEFKAKYGLRYWKTLEDVFSQSYEGTPWTFDDWLVKHKRSYKRFLKNQAK